MMEGIFLGLKIVHINKSCHMYCRGQLAICRVVGCTIGEFGLKVEVENSIESLHGWESTAFLACAVDACVVRARVGF
jgi:hypothetical protein